MNIWGHESWFRVWLWLKYLQIFVLILYLNLVINIFIYLNTYLKNFILKIYLIYLPFYNLKLYIKEAYHLRKEGCYKGNTLPIFYVYIKMIQVTFLGMSFFTSYF